MSTHLTFVGAALRAALVVVLPLLMLAVSLGLAALIGSLFTRLAGKRAPQAEAVSPWLTGRVWTWRQWAAYHGDPSLEHPALSVRRLARPAAAGAAIPPADRGARRHR